MTSASRRSPAAASSLTSPRLNTPSIAPAASFSATNAECDEDTPIEDTPSFGVNSRLPRPPPPPKSGSSSSSPSANKLRTLETIPTARPLRDPPIEPPLRCLGGDGSNNPPVVLGSSSSKSPPVFFTAPFSLPLVPKSASPRLSGLGSINPDADSALTAGAGGG